MNSNEKLQSWREVPLGGVVQDAGNSVEYLGGAWSPVKLAWYEDICIDCLLCWPVCPDDAILAKDGKMAGVDLEHCKDCGICIEACPTKPKSLEFVNEEKFLRGIKI